MTQSRLQLHTQYSGFVLDVDIKWSGETLVLFGPSGSGKSTILEAIAGLRPEVSGYVKVCGTEIQTHTEHPSPEVRRVGWVPQDAALFPHLDVRRNIEFGRCQGVNQAAFERIVRVLEIEPLLNRMVIDLSGGERQRVAVARALVAGAQVLLLDEPLAALERPLRGRILEFLVRLHNELKIPLIYVSHDPHEVTAIGGEVAILDGGTVVASGLHSEVFTNASVLTILETLGVENIFEVSEWETQGELVRVVTTGGSQLNLLPKPAGMSASGDRVAVRAEDILISLKAVQDTTARNIIEGQIVAFDDHQQRTYVRIKVCDDVWTARVTRSAVDDLSLAVGNTVFIVLKASAIHWIDE